MEPRETVNAAADNLRELLDGPARGNMPGVPTVPVQQRLPKVIDAVIAGKDAIALGHVARQIAKMSPEGQRAALCWLVGYFDGGVRDIYGDND